MTFHAGVIMRAITRNSFNQVVNSAGFCSMENNLVAQGHVLTENCDFIVKHLDGEDVIDELIQERLMSRSATQRVQMVGMSRGDKNRIICEQLTTAGPDAVKKFCKVLRNNKRQTFIAERLEECKCKAM